MNNMMNTFIDGLIRMRPDVQNNPKAMEALNAIKSGDAEKGQAIAREICQQNNANPQDAANQASNWFRGLSK